MNKIVHSPRSMVHSYKKILVIRTDRIGDVVLSTPVIKNLRDAYPDSYIAFMVSPYAESIADQNPYLNEVIVYDKKNKHKGLAGNIEFIRALGSKKFDIAIVLHPTKRTHAIVFLANIPHRIGYDKKWGFLLTKRIPHTKQFGLKHELDYTLDILRYLGLTPKDRTLFVNLEKKADQRVGEMLAEHGVDGKDMLIAVNPGASCASKRWPAKRFAEVADKLKEKYSAKIVVLAGSDDKPFAETCVSFMRNKPVNLSGKTDIKELAAILKRAKLFISNDSGPVHIACAVGTPVIAIFGRSDRGLSPQRWAPLGRRDIVLHKYVGCDICMAHNCIKGFECLEAVTVADVLTAADKILKG